MKIILTKASVDDASEIHGMQIACFRPLLDKYHDHAISPATEALSMVEDRLRQPQSDYHFILLDMTKIGAVRVAILENEGKCRISPIFILPEFQGRGVAQAALAELEQQYAPSQGWVLQTILEERGNCHLYEKLGYRQTGMPRQIHPGMHLVTYEKGV